MYCSKCKAPMVSTPVCVSCGTIPIAESSFRELTRRCEQLEASNSVLLERLKCIQHEASINPDMSLGSYFNSTLGVFIRNTIESTTKVKDNAPKPF